MTSTRAADPATPPPSGHVPGPEAPIRRPGTWRNLFFSMALVFLVVAGWFALMPRSAPIARAEVDVVAKAREVNAQAGWPVQVIDGVPGWRATSVSWARSEEGLPTWQAGYHRLPDDQAYVLVGQTRPGSDGADRAALGSWLVRQVRDGARVGEQRIGSATWERFISGDQQARRSLVMRVTTAAPALTTVVTGNLTFEELGQLAGSLRAVAARGSSPASPQSLGWSPPTGSPLPGSPRPGTPLALVAPVVVAPAIRA
ncbi:MAG TPA: DUF4245 family protein [Dermatophilaceae bacterium]|nr:DUF4245 family protein [Dermatophilaceae bacterium]